MLARRGGSKFRPLCNLSSSSVLPVLGGISSTCAVRNSSNWSRNQEPPRTSRGTNLALIGGAALVGAGLWTWNRYGQPIQAASKAVEAESPQTVVKTLPFFTAAQVAEHYDANRRIWVSFGRGVYDVTEFVAQHPGGDKIMMGAGGSVEPFWELYPVHQSPEVFKILARLRIGNLAEGDVVKQDSGSDLFGKEPRRHHSLIPRSARPFNGETPPSLLTLSFYTPNELFYVRNHLPVPEVDVASYELEVEGLHLKRPRSFRLKDLKNFPKTTISASIQCGGNRRADMGVDQPVAGLAWTGGAIGTAKWTGVRLRDVLEAAGFDVSAYKNPEKYHVQFEGLDSDASGESYGASVPLSYILDRNFEPILAFEMNEKVLPVDHGFPVRIILPGIVGARSVKWLGRIRIAQEESNSPWQQRDYKVFSPSVRMETADFSSVPAIMDTPVTSYIASHQDGQTLTDRHQVFQGYAFSGGGRDIVRVEVSTDKGKTWKVAKLIGKQKEGSRNWAWVLWELELDLGPGAQEVWVKAVDTGYNQQPESFSGIWNYRGLLATAYHKIHLNCPSK